MDINDDVDDEPRPDCPACGATEPLKIVYGMVGFEDYQRMRGVTLGGCAVFPDSPQWECRVCEHTFTNSPPTTVEVLRHAVLPLLEELLEDEPDDVQLRREGPRTSSETDLVLVLTVRGRVLRSTLVDREWPTPALDDVRRGLQDEVEVFLADIEQ